MHRDMRMQEFWQADVSAEEFGNSGWRREESKKPAYARAVAGGCIRRRGRIRPRARGKKQETCVCKGCGGRMHPQKRADQTPGQREKARNLRMQELWQADVSAEECGNSGQQREKARNLRTQMQWLKDTSADSLENVFPA